MFANEAVNVLMELERASEPFTPMGADEVRVRCPFHDDATPSCDINIQKRQFNCKSAECRKTGDFITWLAGKYRQPRNVIVVDIQKRYNLDDDKIVDPQTIERWHEAIWTMHPLLNELYIRGITDDDIRLHRIGVEGARITIPVKNKHGNYVNVLKYLPGAPIRKFINLRGRGKLRLFPVEQLDYESLMLCGGPLKAIVAARELNAYGIGAISTTGGEGSWHLSFTPQVVDKQVMVCMDIDKAGQQAASEICLLLSKGCPWVGNLVLPLDLEKYPKGDINDYVGREGGKLFPLIEHVDKWEAKYKERWNGAPPIDADLLTATHATSVGQRMKVKAVVTALQPSSYSVPREVKVRCDRQQDECVACQIFPDSRGDDATWILQPESPAILDMVGTPKSLQRSAIMESLAIPSTCPSCQFDVLKYYNVEDARLSPELQITCRNKDRSMQPAMLISEDINGAEVNESYNFTGRMHPHPKTQQNTLLISNYKASQDSLSTYTVDQDELDALKIFQPVVWTPESINDKLNSLYDDLTANITRIYDRWDMHLMIDLAFHSPLFLQFDGRTDVKGWVEVLIVGDSAQGKSEATKNLVEHYDLGEIVECKNATVAGLLGGLQKLDGRFYVTWGVIPTHDRRLVVLEEVKGAPKEVIAKLTDMRSRGIAELPKIEKRRAKARTRLIWLSNPRGDHRVSSFNYGIEAIRELIGGLEDIRRFDACLIVAGEEIEADRLNQLQRARPTVEHVHTSELCRALVLWVWTRERGYFEPEAVERILDAATMLCREFTDSIPIVDRGSMRNKIARLSAALAGRTFSCNESAELLVRPCHVEFIVEWLRSIYSANAFGYKTFSDHLHQVSTLVDPDEVVKEIGCTPQPNDFVKAILSSDTVDLQDLQDWCNYDRADAQTLLSFLIRKHAVIREGHRYRKNPQFIELMKSTKYPDRPKPPSKYGREY